ncbi:hypothetical protein ACXWQV_10055, partial [Streptococcus pyogenes]
MTDIQSSPTTRCPVRDQTRGVTTVIVREADVGGNIDAVLSLDADRLLLRVTGATSADGSLAIDRTRLR